MANTTWDIKVEPDGEFWLITVAGLEGGTQARSLDEVDEMAIDFVAGMTDASAFTIGIYGRTYRLLKKDS